MADKQEAKLDETTPGGKFIVGGKEVDANGNPIGEGFTPSPTDLLTAQQRIAQLEAQLSQSQEQGDPNSTDTRTNNELKAALTAKGVSYPANANKAALQQLAADNQL